jgi:hypothetical protein
MFDSTSFRHFLSYSASDQRTVRELIGQYDGLLVPGTVAAYQREGTAGFVLSLSAKQARPPYIIDPRFPLFQQKLPRAKPSHTTLAAILGEENLVAADRRPNANDFSHSLVRRIASAWVAFNLGYKDQQSAKFEKYAGRLGETLQLDDASGPQRILAPYFCVTGLNDPWWEVSVQLFDATCQAAAGKLDVTRVLAATSAPGLLEIVEDGRIDDVCVWVSKLDELTTDPANLAMYAQAIMSLSGAGRGSFALYGGFFAAMLSAIGLGGLSHGIGYGEYRDWHELPKSGPPPKRFYLPTIHRYATQDDATTLWHHDRELVGNPPFSPLLHEYHDLMLHSVRARSEEINLFGSLNLAQTINRLEEQGEEFRRRLQGNAPNAYLMRVGNRLIKHLPKWSQALRSLQEQ